MARHGILFDANFFIMGFEDAPARFSQVAAEIKRRGWQPATTTTIINELRREYLKKAIRATLKEISTPLREALELRNEILDVWGKAPKSPQDLSLVLAAVKYPKATIVTNDKLLEETVNYFLSKTEKYRHIEAKTPGTWLMVLADSAEHSKVRQNLKSIAFEFWEEEIKYAVDQRSFGRIRESIEEMLASLRTSRRPPYISLTPIQQELISLSKSLPSLAKEEEAKVVIQKCLDTLPLSYFEAGGALSPRIPQEVILNIVSKQIDLGIRNLVRGDLHAAERCINECLTLTPLFPPEMKGVALQAGILRAITEMANTHIERAEKTLNALATDEITGYQKQTILVLKGLNTSLQGAADLEPIKITEEDLDLLLDIIEEISFASPLMAINGLIHILNNLSTEVSSKRNVSVEQMLARVYLQQVIIPEQDPALVKKVESFAQENPNLLLLNQCVADPSGKDQEIGDLAHERYQDIDLLDERLQKWLDVLTSYSVPGKFGMAKILICRSWSLAINLAIYDSRESIPDQVDESWKIRLDSGKYKVSPSWYPHQSKLIIFPSRDARIIGESSHGIRTIVQFKEPQD